MEKLQISRIETQVYRGVGEQFREAEWAKILPKLEPGIEWKKSVEVELFADPSNPHDSNAVELRVKGVALGFLPADDAEHFSPQLLTLRDDFAMVTARGSIWAVERDGHIHTNISVYLPDLLDDSLESGISPTSKGNLQKVGSLPFCFAFSWAFLVLIAFTSESGNRG